MQDAFPIKWQPTAPIGGPFAAKQHEKVLSPLRYHSMPASIDDIFEFLKKDKDERLKEKEKDRIELKQLISEGVKKEVASIITPVTDRVKCVEGVQESVEEKMKVMSDEIKELKVQLYAKTSVKQSVPDNQFQNRISESDSTSVGQANKVSSDLLEIISLGRRTIGLHKIDEADLERMRQEQYGGAKTEEEEKQLAVKEFLRCELKIDSDTIDSMEIERIFPLLSVILNTSM